VTPWRWDGRERTRAERPQAMSAAVAAVDAEPGSAAAVVQDSLL